MGLLEKASLDPVHSLADVTCQFLDDLGISLNPTPEEAFAIGCIWTVSAPDRHVFLLDTEGRGVKRRSTRTGKVHEHCGLQIIVRSNDYFSARKMAVAITSELSSISQKKVLMGDPEPLEYELISFTRVSGILNAGRDAKDRDLVSTNFIAAYKQL